MKAKVKFNKSFPIQFIVLKIHMFEHLNNNGNSAS